MRSLSKMVREQSNCFSGELFESSLTVGDNSFLKKTIKSRLGSMTDAFFDITRQECGRDKTI